MVSVLLFQIALLTGACDHQYMDSDYHTGDPICFDVWELENTVSWDEPADQRTCDVITTP